MVQKFHSTTFGLLQSIRRGRLASIILVVHVCVCAHSEAIKSQTERPGIEPRAPRRREPKKIDKNNSLLIKNTFSHKQAAPKKAGRDEILYLFFHPEKPTAQHTNAARLRHRKQASKGVFFGHSKVGW